jgi:hypothetical protein
MRMPCLSLSLALLGALALQPIVAAEDSFAPLFPRDGTPEGWTVREWNDLAREAGKDTAWAVKDGVLRSGKRRGT